MELNLFSLLLTIVCSGLTVFLLLEPSEAEVRGAFSLFSVFLLGIFVCLAIYMLDVYSF